MSTEEHLAKAAAWLARAELFQGLSADQRALIAKSMQPVAFAQGSSIFSRGDPGTQLYLVNEGRVRLSVLTEDGRELAFAHAVEGDVFGEIAAIDGGPRTADANALTSVKALALGKANVDRFIQDMPAFARSIASFLCNRLRSTDVKLETIVMHPIEVRLARLILAFARAQGAKGDQRDVLVKLDMSQTEISLLIGASRPKVNTALAALADLGAVKPNGRNLVCDLVDLASIAGDA